MNFPVYLSKTYLFCCLGKEDTEGDIGFGEGVGEGVLVKTIGSELEEGSCLFFEGFKI